MHSLHVATAFLGCTTGTETRKSVFQISIIYNSIKIIPVHTRIHMVINNES